MNRRTLKKCSYLLLCIVAIYGYYYQNKNKEIQKEVTITDYQDYKQVVYIDSDGILIPVSCTIDDCPTIQSEVYELFNLMKNPTGFLTHINSVIPEKTQLESVIIENDLLQLHFSELQTDSELRFLEAVSFVFNQLEGINGIELFVGGNKINQLPNGQIVFNAPLTEDLGINNFETGFKNLHQTQSVTVYYTKNIDGVELYIPISKRIDAKSTLHQQLDAIVSEISVSSTLNKASLFEGVSVLEGSYLQDGHLYVNMNELVLLDEHTINADVYDLLLLSFSKIEGVEKVTILVDGEIIETRETVSVSDIVYNVVKI